MSAWLVYVFIAHIEIYRNDETNFGCDLKIIVEF